MDTFSLDPLALIRPRRKIVGMSAILLPFDEGVPSIGPGFATTWHERSSQA